MNILVAPKALIWCAGKIDSSLSVSRGSKRRGGHRVVACRTSRALMRALQWEFGGSVIETTELFPVPGVVASLTGLFGGMRIHMTPGARLIREMILPGSWRRRPRNMRRARIIHVF